VTGKSKWLIALLAVSLAFNLFFIGAWTGRHFAQRGRGPDHEVMGVRAFLRRSGLADADPQVQKVVQARRKQIRERFHALRQAREAVRDALQAQPFDPTRLERALAEAEARSSEMQRDMHGALSEVAREVGAEQRQKMADALWPRPRKHPR
jgi:uncharacterized membrane protein